MSHPTTPASSAPGYDVCSVRTEFPALEQRVHGKPLVYLDNAATTHKPQAVLESMMRFYRLDNSNVHRGVHELSIRATEAFEGARDKVRRFIHAASPHEIIFVRGTTEAINLVATCFARPRLAPGDEIVVSAMEHHSNIVPWQIVCEQTGARLRVVPMNDAGELLLDEYRALLGPRTRLVAVVQVSNALGTVNPVREMIELAHAQGVPVLLDSAQAVAHTPIDVQALGCDFLAFSGHKLYGPTGIGVLYGRESLLENMPPYQGGGDMIESVTFEKTTYNRLPYKFEAGTPDIAAAIALGSAVDFVGRIGLENIEAYERGLLQYATTAVGTLPRLRVIGTARKKAAVLSFVLDGIHPHDVGTILDRQGIAIRTGHHCAQPVMERYGVVATARASFACYNTREEIDTLVAGLAKVVEVFAA